MKEWTLSEDRLTLRKIFYENKIETLELSDLAGNITKVTINVDSIESKPANENQLQNNVNTNTTIENHTGQINNKVTNKVLPAAGITTGIKIFIVIAFVGMIVFYIKYKNLKDIVK